MEEMKLASLPKLDAPGLAEAEAKALELLKKEPRVYKLISETFQLTRAQTKRSLSPLLDLAEDLHYCDRCPGYEACAKQVPHYQLNLTYEDDLVDRQLVLCPIAKERETYISHFIDRDFPLEWMKKNVSDFQGSNKRSLQIAMGKALSQKKSRWFFVQGSRGVGRTFALACFANTWVSQDRGQVAFVDTTNFMDRMKNAFYDRDKSKFNDLIATYSTCSLLVFDDFGNESKDKTGFAYSTILFPILNERAKNGLCTCFSSDFTIEEIADMYSPSIGGPRARQYRELLMGMCEKMFAIKGLAGW